MIATEILSSAQLLAAQNLTIAFAESATAGRVVAAFSLVPDAGQFLKGGLVCYDARLKEQILGVSKELVAMFTPESAEVTAAMATGLVKIIPADIYIAVTGLIAPGGSETAEKPVGTMFLHIRREDLAVEFAERVTLSGSPEEIIMKTVKHTGSLLKKILQANRMYTNNVKELTG